MSVDLDISVECGIAVASAVDQHVIDSAGEANIGVGWIARVAQRIAAGIAVEVSGVEILVSSATRYAHLCCEIQIRISSRTGPFHHEENGVNLPTKSTGCVVWG